MAWYRSRSVLTTARPESIWGRWTIPAHWTQDDPSTTDNRFAVPPRVGDRGVIHGYAGAQEFTFTELVANERMTFTMRLPGARLTLPHWMESTPQGLKVTHAFRLDGPLAFLYALIVGRRLVRELPHVMDLVVDHALQDEQEVPA